MLTALGHKLQNGEGQNGRGAARYPSTGARGAEGGDSGRARVRALWRRGHLPLPIWSVVLSGPTLTTSTVQ